jgi:hypothetical protein
LAVSPGEWGDYLFAGKARSYNGTSFAGVARFYHRTQGVLLQQRIVRGRGPLLHDAQYRLIIYAD